MIENTNLHNFLLALKDVGYRQIQISLGCVRAWPDYSARDLPRLNDTIALWEVGRKYGYEVSCGNSHQMQPNFYGDYTRDMKALISALKEANLLDKGDWHKLTSADAFKGGLVINLGTYKPFSKAIAVLYKKV